MSDSFPARRLARAIVRQLRLQRDSRILDVGCGNGEVVGLLRRVKMEAYGLFDGPPLDHSDERDVPELQPATLHQSMPFLAQSFDAVVIRQTADYELSLATPEACTATANLLAALKPGGVFIYCGTTDYRLLQQHLAQFSGQGRHITLGTGGLMHLLLRMSGLAKPGLPALMFTIPHEPISRLEWHRIARDAVVNLSRADANEAEKPSAVAADSPAA